MSDTIEREFEEVDAENRWQPMYLEIRSQSHDYPHKVAKSLENRNRNRYRDVSPYDHSRVKLQNTENDYINASFVAIEEAQRNYILTQGPLPNTCCHFWLMVWQQKSKAVVMLNRIVEKDSIKCAQYWPTKEDKVMVFEETGFCVRLVSEDVKSYYTVHLLKLENLHSGEIRLISHFHYTTWPDFGVPQSPASFLNFLFKVRESGSLSDEHGPAIIHCSAGIGRSGTFSLVDTCLVLKRWKELSNEDEAPNYEHSPPHPTKIIPGKYNGNRLELESGEKDEKINLTELSTKMQDTVTESTESAVRKRYREDRKANTAQKVQQMKQRLSETERKRKRWLYWKPILTKIGFGTIILVGAFACWTMYFRQHSLQIKP
ncbi:tyrosine-protein phosphatase non-receptor type 2 isoform X4 [Monodelphis domestica]|uniref:tyrosine-protein phosphatase non-receptor type 2 isoform X4 n=1 Tax=Monodelphis domestica TaxID=13616 RepID=UPI0004436616|nr:tyrosine-protein phosphatase non-receptor type 2 isoform X4 [Monodelphis domestica]